MVFLRLIIKVYPREQLSRKPTPEAHDDQTAKPASFLLALPNPEEVSLGQLANLIRSKWIKLRPNAEPLDIKKLLDDNRDSVDLDVDMTVADVWVNKARARKNEDDQDGVVRVVQRPAPYAPVRFPSVDQDWGVGGREGKGFKGTFETIEEESSEESEEESEEEGVNGGRMVEVKAEDEEDRSEESGEEEGESEDEEGESEDEDESENENEQVNGNVEAEMETVDEGESEEQIPDNDVTMEDSLPEMRVLKRKLSPEELEPKKQARLEPPNHAPQEDADNADKANGTPLSSPLGARKRDADRAPSFSGLNRRLSFTERPASSHGLGLGITKSPPRKETFLIADIFKDSTQSASVPDDTRLSPTSVPPSSAPIRRSSINQHPSTPAKLQTPADKVKQLQSALRKDSPAERTPERRSVSFSGEDHVFPTVPAPKSVPQTANKEEKKAAKSGVLPEPASQETEDQSKEKAEAGLFAEVNMETNEYEEELLRAEDLDPKGDYVRKLKLASKRWQVMINNKNKTRTREIERYHNAIRDLKTLNRELLELNESNAPPTQRPRSQTPNGTPATRKLSRPETTCSQGRKSGEHWNVEILTPKPNSKKLMSKDVPASQKSRKSEEEDGQQEEVEGHWEVEIHTPRPNGTPLRQSESKKLSSPKRPPTPSEESGSEEESSSEKETESAVPNSVTKPSPPDKVSKREAKPVSQSGLDSEEEQSGSDEEGSDSEEAEEEAAEAAAAVAEAVQNDKTPTTTKPNPESQPSSKPDPQSDEETSSGSDSESEASDASSGSESEKENQLPKPTPQTKADLLRRTSLNLPSSQNKSSIDHPTSSQSTPTGPRAPRQTLKGLLRKQREEQSEKARAKAEAEKVQRQRQQPHKDIFSGPSDSESEEESDSSSDSGADAGDILSSGTVGKLRPAFGRK